MENAGSKKVNERRRQVLIKIVTKDWLVDCVKQEGWIKEDQYLLTGDESDETSIVENQKQTSTPKDKTLMFSDPLPEHSAIIPPPFDSMGRPYKRNIVRSSTDSICLDAPIQSRSSIVAGETNLTKSAENLTIQQQSLITSPIHQNSNQSVARRSARASTPVKGGRVSSAAIATDLFNTNKVAEELSRQTEVSQTARLPFKPVNNIEVEAPNLTYIKQASAGTANKDNAMATTNTTESMSSNKDVIANDIFSKCAFYLHGTVEEGVVDIWEISTNLDASPMTPNELVCAKVRYVLTNEMRSQKTHATFIDDLSEAKKLEAYNDIRLIYVIVANFHHSCDSFDRLLGEIERLDIVTPVEIVTLPYFFACMNQQQHLSPNDNVLFRPLLLADGASTIMRNENVCVSGYILELRACLKILVTLLGGGFEEFMRRTNKSGDATTTLLVGTTDSKKYDAARKWGINIVSHTYFVEAAITGKMPSVSDHMLLDDTEVFYNDRTLKYRRHDDMWLRSTTSYGKALRIHRPLTQTAECSAMSLRLSSHFTHTKSSTNRISQMDQDSIQHSSKLHGTASTSKSDSREKIESPLVKPGTEPPSVFMKEGWRPNFSTKRMLELVNVTPERDDPTSSPTTSTISRTSQDSLILLVPRLITTMCSNTSALPVGDTIDERLRVADVIANGDDLEQLPPLLLDTIIAFDRLMKKSKAVELIRRAHAMCAHVIDINEIPEYLRKGKLTHMIVAIVNSDNRRRLIEMRRHGVTLILPAWIDLCADERRRIEIDKYIVKLDDGDMGTVKHLELNPDSSTPQLTEKTVNKNNSPSRNKNDVLTDHRINEALRPLAQLSSKSSTYDIGGKRKRPHSRNKKGDIISFDSYYLENKKENIHLKEKEIVLPSQRIPTVQYEEEPEPQFNGVDFLALMSDPKRATPVQHEPPVTDDESIFNDFELSSSAEPIDADDFDRLNNIAVPTESVFCISGFAKQAQLELQRKLEELNAKVSEKLEDDWTHLIVGEPKRSEKVLLCIARARWMLHPDYVTESHRLGKLQLPAKFDWASMHIRQLVTESITMDEQIYIREMNANNWSESMKNILRIGEAARQARILLAKVKPHHPASFSLMANVRTTIFAVTTERRNTFMNILKCMGVVVVDLTDCRNIVDAKDRLTGLDYILCEKKACSKIPQCIITAATTLQIHFIDVAYLSQFLLGGFQHIKSENDALRLRSNFRLTI